MKAQIQWDCVVCGLPAIMYGVKLKGGEWSQVHGLCDACSEFEEVQDEYDVVLSREEAGVLEVMES